MTLELSLLPPPGKILEKKKYVLDYKITSVIMIYLVHFNMVIVKVTQRNLPLGIHLSTIIDNIIINKPIFCLYLDYKKAFDTISHLIMLKKVSALGLNEQACGWFNSYLTLRTQCTIANDCISPSRTIIYGVPEDSVLGPVLFSIYINSLTKIYDFNITLYADDAVISITAPERMHELLPVLSKWCINNSLTVNEKKTKWMVFNVNNDNPVFTLNNTVLERVYTFPYLGLTLDPNLKFIDPRKGVVTNIFYVEYCDNNIFNYSTCMVQISPGPILCRINK